MVTDWRSYPPFFFIRKTLDAEIVHPNCLVTFVCSYMIEFTASIKKFEKNAEKTGWTYIDVEADLASAIMPDHKKAFRVRGYLDDHYFEGTSLLPSGGGNYIMAINAAMRKATRKKHGATIRVRLEYDAAPLLPPQELMECLSDEPVALAHFQKLTKGHQNYFTKWINEARTDFTRTKRLAMAVNALSRGLDFGEMLRSHKKER